MSEEQQGVVFPRSDDGRRSTTAVGRAVLADALAAVDPGSARRAAQATNWRTDYLGPFRSAVEAGVGSRAAAMTIASEGLASLHRRMRVANHDGAETGLAEWASGGGGYAGFGTATVTGTADPETELSLPLEGRRLRGDDLRRQLDTWVADGVVEPSAARAVKVVAENPSWLRAEGFTVAVLGAGAEMGPLQALLRWGARVAAVDLPRPELWERVLGHATAGAGVLLLPVREGGGEADPRSAGADLLCEAPAVGEWLARLEGRPVVGNYVYADGATNVRVATAVDVLSDRLLDVREDAVLAFLATPTDVFAVPADAVRHSEAAYAARSSRTKAVARPLRSLSRGRLLSRNYVPGADPGTHDALVPQQGPNYALAKRLQRWRATVARDAGRTVSLNVAPPTRTRSVVKNRALAAAYAGAHRFGVQVFEPATSNVLMAALLVHDLHTDGGPRHDHPWQDEAEGAVHGGLWRAPYAPRSALGLAALLGYAAQRG